ncbi:MAG: ferredoxin [Gemmatimonadales bacterium]|nr:MAG: ferredoxin [Gemmatimonadales bacterium]
MDTHFRGGAVAGTEERTFGEYRVQIDRLLCVGFGDCIAEAPGAFEFDDEGIAVFRKGAEEESLVALLDACASCPVDALTVWDGSGEQIIP